MSKKGQTTGLPTRRRRRAVVEDAQAQADASYQSRAEREERLQKLVIRGVIIVSALLAAAIAIAFAIEQVVTPNQAVARVNGEAITVRQFREQFTLERTRLSLQLNQLQNAGIDMQQLSQTEPYRTWISEVNVPDQLGLRVINDMVDDLLLAREAEARDIRVDEATLAREVERYFGYDPTEAALVGAEPSDTPEATITPTPYVSPTPTHTPMPTATATPGEPEPTEASEPTATPQPTVVEPTLSPTELRENFDENRESYRNYLSINGVSEQTIDGYFERLALEAMLRDDLIGEDGLLYADARHILLESEEAANEALMALRAGESFAELARAISTDQGSGYRGGELGEAFVGNYVREFRLAIENAEPGALVGPVQSEFGYHILQVRSKEMRSGEAIAAQLDSAKERELAFFVESVREQNEAGVEILDSWLDHMPQG